MGLCEFCGIAYFDLIVWLGDATTIIGFQLCYDIDSGHHALTWHQNSGYAHNRIDDGENRPGKMKASPILLPDGVFEYERIAKKFEAESQELEAWLSSFIYDKIMQYPM